MDLRDQIKWERECIERGTERYYASQDRLREAGQGDQVDAISHLFHERLQEVEDKLRAKSEKTVGKGCKYNVLVKRAAFRSDLTRIAYIATQTAFQIVSSPKENTALRVCLDISTRLEDDLKCRLFEAEHPIYYKRVIDSFKDQKVTDYQHMHKVLMKKFTEFELGWLSWTSEHKLKLGGIVLQCVLETFDDVLYINKQWHGIKSTYMLDTTAAFDEWAGEFERERGFMFPYLLPLKIRPRDWDEHGQGGYYTSAMCHKLPLVKTKGKAHRNFVRQHDPVHHRNAINKMQATAWQVNKRVFDVQKEIYEKGLGVGIPSSVQLKPPPFPEHLKDIAREDLTPSQKAEVTSWKGISKRIYGNEQERKGRVIAFMQTHKLALELRDWEEFYFAYNCDFRGRIYCATTGLTPQGNDVAKGLLRFANGVELGERGVYWLAVQGANTFGNDKLRYDDRVQWIKNNEIHIRKVVEDPISSREWWGEADKPYQFLAFCFEWADCDYGRDTTALGHIPVGLDGSCNGLQHFSALLRDSVGGAATNLSNSELPKDIYQDVADVLIKKLEERKDDPRARIWLRVGIDRKLTKRPVMVLPYGATQTAAKQYILEYAVDNWSKFRIDQKHQWELALYLTPILWESISEVVIAATEAMAWLRKNVSNKYMCWTTPLGFPVYQYYKKCRRKIVETQLCGSIELLLNDNDLQGKPRMPRQRSGISPNFVHSIDSTHMVLTINNTELEGYAMIHDDFGTHAGNTQLLFDSIRTSFYELYTKYDPLKDWAEQHDIDTDTLPDKGDYNIEDILEAQYFFG